MEKKFLDMVAEIGNELKEQCGKEAKRGFVIIAYDGEEDAVACGAYDMDGMSATISACMGNKNKDNKVGILMDVVSFAHVCSRISKNDLNTMEKTILAAAMTSAVDKMNGAQKEQQTKESVKPQNLS